MKISHKISIQIGGFVFLCGVVFFIIALYWYQDYESVKEFLEHFIIPKNIYLLVCIAIFSLCIWIISKYFIWHIFEKIEINNAKLKDYNHFLAHELKTPISVIYSNLDVLSYWFDEKIIHASRNELKNMIRIVDWLLNFSESMKISDKWEINLENFIKMHSASLENSGDILIHNNEFNFSIITDELLFMRVVKNLIDNALKYSDNHKLDIYIQEDKLVFINNIEKTLWKWDLEKVQEKFFSKTFEEKKGHGIGIPMLTEIVKKLWYEMKISSKEKQFIVEIIY